MPRRTTAFILNTLFLKGGLAVITLLTLLLIYGKYNGYHVAYESEEWSNFGAYLGGISAAATFIIALITASILLKQVSDQKEVNNFDRLIKHRTLFFEAIDNFISSHKNMSLSNKDKTYYEFFPENKVTHLSLLLDPIKTPKLQKLFSLIRHDDKDQAKRISNTQNAIRELIEINSFLGIQRKEDIPGDIIFHGHNYGANIFDINNTYISCLKYLNCLDAFFETRELVPSQVKRYTKPQLGTIINDIAHMSRKNEEVYIYSDETTYPALFTSALIRRLEVAGRWVLAPGALSTP